MRRLLPALVFLALTLPARAETSTFGPFSVDSAAPDILRLDGELGPDSDTRFDEALAAHPGIRILVLDSAGGTASSGLAIALVVDRLGLATFIPPGARCYSACSKIFFAGRERAAIGGLGVHQSSSDDAELGFGGPLVGSFQLQAALGVDPRVMALALTTPPETMYVFSPAEIEAFGIDARGPVLAPLIAAAASYDGPPVEPGLLEYDLDDLVPAWEALIARVAEDPGLLRAATERTVGPLPDAIWEAYFRHYFGVLADPRFITYLTGELERRGIAASDIADGAGSALGMAMFQQLAFDGLARLPLPQLEAYFRSERDLTADLQRTQPEACLTVMDGTDLTAAIRLRVQYLIDRPAEADAFFALSANAVTAALDPAQPAPVFTAARAAAIGAALSERLLEVLGRSERPEVVMEAMDSPADAPPDAVCELGVLLFDALLTLDKPLREDALRWFVVTE